MSSKRFFGEYLEVDRADGAGIAFAREALRLRMQARLDHERAACPGVKMAKSKIDLRQEKGQWRLVSDLVLIYPDAERVPVEAR
jgi:hypothetical protein